MIRGFLRGRTGLLLRAVEGTEWRQLLDYVSPAFFDVVPLGGLVTQARELAAHAADARGFARVRSGAERALAARGIAVSLVAGALPAAAALSALGEAERAALGQRALEIYFAQLFHGDVTLLDLRASRFAPAAAAGGDLPASGAPRWAPRPWWVRWDADFMAGVRDLYRGFYRPDDASFLRGAEALGLGDAADLLRAHFGAGDQRRVRFRSRDFHAVFHDVFVRCSQQGRSLHRGFLPLGIYLACLYDLLETLDLELDVRAAFERGAEGEG